MRDLTEREREVIDLLAQAWNRHQELEEIHGSDSPEFAAAIHAAQNIVLARPGAEQLKAEAYGTADEIYMDQEPEPVKIITFQGYIHDLRREQKEIVERNRNRD